MKKIFKFILELIIVIFVFMAVVEIAFILMKDENGVTHFGNYIPIPIKDDNMEPTINMDDLIIAKEVSTPSKIKENDIITYLVINDDKKEVRTGRVISVVNSNNVVAWKVRGYNQGESNITTVSSNDLIGQFTNTKMLFAGGLLAFAESQNGFLVCIIVPLLLIFFIQICKLIHTLIASKKEKKEENELNNEKEKDNREEQTQIQEQVKSEISNEENHQNKYNIAEDNKDELAAPIVVPEPIQEEKPTTETIEQEELDAEKPEIDMPNENKKENSFEEEPPIIDEMEAPTFSEPQVESIPILEEDNPTQEQSEQVTTNDNTTNNNQSPSDDIEIL